MRRRASFLLIGLLTAGCDQRFTEVDHPFYLGYIEDPREVALFRCPKGPSAGCAIDGLPGPVVTAAGADRRFIVVETMRGYYYFARVPQETSGWGGNPERILGPLSTAEFDAARRELRLPEFEVQP